MDKVSHSRDEKVLLIAPGRSTSPRSAKSIAFKLLALTSCLLLGLFQLATYSTLLEDVDNQSICPQVEPLVSEKHRTLASELGGLYDTDAFKLRAVDWIAGAVRIPYVQLTASCRDALIKITRTESYDGMDDVGVDPRWEIFDKFHAYLAEVFPLV